MQLLFHSYLAPILHRGWWCMPCLLMILNLSLDIETNYQGQHWFRALWSTNKLSLWSSIHKMLEYMKNDNVNKWKRSKVILHLVWPMRQIDSTATLCGKRGNSTIDEVAAWNKRIVSEPQNTAYISVQLRIMYGGAMQNHQNCNGFMYMTQLG